jgi:hypothetical protein
MKVKLNKMPDKETLEAFIEGLIGGDNQVFFDSELGELVWHKDNVRPLDPYTSKK